MKTLLVATATVILCLVSPALASWTHWAPLRGWACSAYEYKHWCNAELNVHTGRCRCLVR